MESISTNSVYYISCKSEENVKIYNEHVMLSKDMPKECK